MCRDDHLRLRQGVTGDSILRTVAVNVSLPCHGVLWILDQIHQAGISTLEDIVRGLQAIRIHSSCRLLQDEISDRIVRYSSRPWETDTGTRKELRFS